MAMRPRPQMEMTCCSMESERSQEDLADQPKPHGDEGHRPPLFLNFSGSLSSLGGTARSDMMISKPGTPLPDRASYHNITGRVDVIIFDFDGTLTATPGDRQVRSQKRIEISERAALLQPKLRALREAGCLLGILSKSTEVTIRDALAAGGLTSFFDAPIIGKAIGFEGKAGYIHDLARQGSLRRPGDRRPGPISHRILLVDDDVLELERARAAGFQTYAAPTEGGLQENDFQYIIESLKLPPNRPPRAPSGGGGGLGALSRLNSCPSGTGTASTQSWFPSKSLERGPHPDAGKWRTLILFSGDCFEG